MRLFENKYQINRLTNQRIKKSTANGIKKYSGRNHKNFEKNAIFVAVILKN